MYFSGKWAHEAQSESATEMKRTISVAFNSELQAWEASTYAFLSHKLAADAKARSMVLSAFMGAIKNAMEALAQTVLARVTRCPDPRSEAERLAERGNGCWVSLHEFIEEVLAGVHPWSVQLPERVAVELSKAEPVATVSVKLLWQLRPAEDGVGLQVRYDWLANLLVATPKGPRRFQSVAELEAADYNAGSPAVH